MKKVFVIIIALLATTFAKAQEYKPFKVNVSVGYANPAGSGIKGGFLMGIEPKYSISTRIEVGLRLESGPDGTGG